MRRLVDLESKGQSLALRILTILGSNTFSDPEVGIALGATTFKLGIGDIRSPEIAAEYSERFENIGLEIVQNLTDECGLQPNEVYLVLSSMFSALATMQIR